MSATANAIRQMCRWDTRGTALDCPAYADARSAHGYCAAHEAMCEKAREFLSLRDRLGISAAAMWAIQQECDPDALARLAKEISRGRRK